MGKELIDELAALATTAREETAAWTTQAPDIDTEESAEDITTMHRALDTYGFPNPDEDTYPDSADDEGFVDDSYREDLEEETPSFHGQNKEKSKMATLAKVVGAAVLVFGTQALVLKIIDGVTTNEAVTEEAPAKAEVATDLPLFDWPEDDPKDLIPVTSTTIAIAEEVPASTTTTTAATPAARRASAKPPTASSTTASTSTPSSTSSTTIAGTTTTLPTSPAAAAANTPTTTPTTTTPTPPTTEAPRLSPEEAAIEGGNYDDPKHKELLKRISKQDYPVLVNFQLDPAFWVAQGYKTDAEITRGILTSIVRSEHACFNVGCARTDPNFISKYYSNVGPEFVDHIKNGHRNLFSTSTAYPATAETFQSKRVNCPGGLTGTIYWGKFDGYYYDRSHLEPQTDTEKILIGTPYTTKYPAYTIAYVIVDTPNGKRIWGYPGYQHAQDAASMCGLTG